MMSVKPWHLGVHGPLEKASCQASLLCDCEGIRMLIYPWGPLHFQSLSLLPAPGALTPAKREEEAGGRWQSLPLLPAGTESCSAGHPAALEGLL